jgi:hypothetical protein
VAESGVAAYACNDQVDRQAKFLKRARLRLAFLTDNLLSLILPTDALSVRYFSRQNLFHSVK